MAARAIWKAVIHCGELQVPVKLYSAVEDRNIHFRVLSRKDKLPVRQAMVNPETGETVAHADTLRAYVAPTGDRVMLQVAELEALEAKPSRDIDLVAFLPPGQIDHRWYERPYYLAPDGDRGAYSALVEAIEGSGAEGLARWVMRGRAYVGALRIHLGFPVLISMRNADEVIAASHLEAPAGAALNPKELDMARQLVGMLAAELDLGEYHDQYRHRVLELVQSKAKGGRRLTLVKSAAKKPSDDLGRALQASLKAVRKSA